MGQDHIAPEFVVLYPKNQKNVKELLNYGKIAT